MKKINKSISIDKSKCAEIGKACVCSNLRKASRLITHIYDVVLRPSGLRGTQFGLLMTIKGFGSITVTKLARWAIMDRTTVTRNLKLLEQKGFVTIEPGKDLRSRVVTLTDAGSTVIETAYPFWEKAQHRVADIFGENRTGRIVKELSEMVSTLRKQ